MSKHTKGPWDVNRYNDLAYTIISKSDMDRQDDSFIEDEEDEANAKLIAAAPDLLEALNLAKTAIENNPLPGYAPLLSIINKAIEKAEGTNE